MINFNPADSNGLVHSELECIQRQLDQLRQRLDGPDTAVSGDVAQETLKGLAGEIIKSRRRREKVFGSKLFGEPAWDILLELYAAELAEKPLSVSGTCYASGVPQSTALRWLVRLEQCGWVSRYDDPRDARRSWVALSERASARMREYLSGMAIRPI